MGNKDKRKEEKKKKKADSKPIVSSLVKPIQAQPEVVKKTRKTGE